MNRSESAEIVAAVGLALELAFALTGLPVALFVATQCFLVAWLLERRR